MQIDSKMEKINFGLIHYDFRFRNVGKTKLIYLPSTEIWEVN